MFGPAGGIALNAKGLEGHGHLGVSAAVEQLQFIAGGEVALEALASQGSPRGPHHQHHQARVHKQRTNPTAHPLASRQATGVALQLPALGGQVLFQSVQAAAGIAALERFRQGEFAELPR